MSYLRFKDRNEAASILASKLIEYREKHPVVLAIPRGGVVIAFKIAKELNAPLDLIIPRKIGAPGNSELAIGAVTEDGTTILNKQLIDMLNVSDEYIKLQKDKQIQEIQRRIHTYRGDALSESIEGKTVIIVDDGVATGATLKAAVTSIRNKHPLSILIAIPVGPPDTVNELRNNVDRLICLIIFEPFYAISQFYENFNQVSDEEVIQLVKQSRN